MSSTRLSAAMPGRTGSSPTGRRWRRSCATSGSRVSSSRRSRSRSCSFRPMGDTTVGPAGRRDREGAIRAGLARAGRKLHDMPYRFTREDTVSKTRFINPQGLSKPPGYTHVVEATAPARLVYIAGQLGMDRDGKLSSDFRLQAVQTFENLKTALAAVGATFQHVVKLNNYLVNLTHLPIFRQVRDSYLAEGTGPARTTLEIPGLARGAQCWRWRRSRCCRRRPRAG